MIIFIGCGKFKNNVSCVAEKMYIGNYFKTCLTYAKCVCNSNDSIYILSAKYGVLSLDKVIEPYDITLNNYSTAEYNNWLNKVIVQLKKLHITNKEKVMFLCGKNYYKGLCSYFTDYVIPLKDYPGMGYQIQYMNKYINNKSVKKLF